MSKPAPVSSRDRYLIGDILDRGIVLVDDDEAIRLLLKRILERTRYRFVYQACCAEEAYDLLAEHGDRIYLLVLDFRLPGPTGLDILSHIINRNPTPIGALMVTGYPTTSTAVDFTKMAERSSVPGEFLAKPLSSKEFLAHVRRLLEFTHRNRIDHPDKVDRKLRERMVTIGDSVERIEAGIAGLKRDTARIASSKRGLLAQLGYDLVRAIVVALGFTALLLLGFGKILKWLLEAAGVALP